MIEQTALPADHVLHRAHLLPAALALRLGALAVPPVLGARVAQPVEHALQFRHALLRLVHPALARRLARLFRHPVQIPVGEAPGVRVERHLVVVAPRLFRQRLQMALDRLLQLLQPAIQGFAVGIVRLVNRLVQRVACGLTRLIQRPRGALGLAFLQVQRKIPHPLLRLADRFGRPVQPEQIIDAR